MKKEIVFKIVIGISCLLIGFFSGYWLGDLNSDKAWQGKLDELKKENEQCKSQLEITFPPLPEEIYSVFGKITKIEGNSVWIETQIRTSRFPLPGGKEIETKEIKINTSNETKIVKIEFLATPPSPSEGPFKEVSLKFEDLKVGNQVLVTSKENIKGKTEILAEKIQLIF